MGPGPLPVGGNASGWLSKRVAEMLAKELPKVKPDKWGCVQASQLWYAHMCIQKKEKERAREQERRSEREKKTEKV